MEPGLIFSRSGTRQRLYAVNPLLFSQYESINDLFLPCPRDLPSTGLKTVLYPFDFGYSNPNNAIVPFQQTPVSVIFGNDCLIESVTGIYNVMPPQTLQNPAYQPPALGASGANISPGFLVNVFHTHAGVETQWANKDIVDTLFVGNARHPRLLKDPALILAGDTLTFQVTNLNNVLLQVQILLVCGEFDAEQAQQSA